MHDRNEEYSRAEDAFREKIQGEICARDQGPRLGPRFLYPFSAVCNLLNFFLSSLVNGKADFLVEDEKVYIGYLVTPAEPSFCFLVIWIRFLEQYLHKEI